MHEESLNLPLLCNMIADEATSQYFDNLFKIRDVSDCTSFADRDAIEAAIEELFGNEDFDNRRRGLLSDHLLCELDPHRQPSDIVDEADALSLYKELVSALLPKLYRRIKKRYGVKYEEVQMRRDEVANLLQVHPDLLHSLLPA